MGAREMTRSFNLGELFCGPGGLALGAMGAFASKDGEEYRIKPLWANDFDSSTCETYRTNICPDHEDHVICKDVRELDIESLPQIDALAFGFPCNDFSVVGEQKGTGGSYGRLYSYGVRALRHFRPEWFLAENVGGLQNANGGKDLENILGEMHAAGYDLWPNLYKFEQYGVPQARHRIIIIGIRKDLKLEFKIPAPTTLESPVTCRQALEDPPLGADVANNELTAQNETVVQRLRHIKPGQNAFTADIPEHLRLNVRKTKISQIYKRLDPEKPAYTITGSGGGGTHVYHWSEDRALTNRERARLQTFPDSYVFCGSKESVRKQIGMAVPSAGARVIFEAVLKTFARIPYTNVEPSMAPMVHRRNTLESYGMDSKQQGVEAD